MGTIENIYSTLRRAKEISDHIKNADLLGVLADLKFQISNLKEEVVRLREENVNLRVQKNLRAKVFFRDGLYYLSEPVPGLSQGPFCPTCWENRATLITLERTQRWCNICNRCFRPKSDLPSSSYDS